MAEQEFDFVIVGSGAGGGPLAANLAEAGFEVALLEAGDHHECRYYDVPIMQARASEDREMTWDFFVRHYDSDQTQRGDTKYVSERDGVWYPRGSTVGGSTAVSAMVTVYPHDSDWDSIAELTGDESWRAQDMRRYFTRIEHWRGQDAEPAPGQPPATDPSNPADHGYDGWLQTTRAKPAIAGREPWFLRIIDAVEQTARQKLGLDEDVPQPRDPNDVRVVSERLQGMNFIPTAIGDGVRNGARERVYAAVDSGLTLITNALVTKVLLDGDTAVGVEYLDGAHLYGADPHQGTTNGARKTIQARKEVILAGGVYNTPQLLKLSGIGDREELTRHGIEVRHELPGVGKNLQDRYEVGVINKMVHDFSVFDGAMLDAQAADRDQDPLYREWDAERDGPYSTNGSLASLILKSSVAETEPDLFIFALPAYFGGYYPGYAEDGAQYHNATTVLVLKGHTRNRGGEVRLRSADPTDVPDIRFHYFEEGSDEEGADLEGVVDGVEIARDVLSRISDISAEELVPGAHVDDREKLKEFVRNEAWGHHASCTCPIGTDDDPDAVLDSEFRVRGIKNLRVVDASVFPRIPGLFICSAVYMIAEKASDVIKAAHQPSET